MGSQDMDKDLSHEEKPSYFPLHPGCLIAIPIMEYNKPYNKGWYNPLNNPTKQGFFRSSFCMYMDIPIDIFGMYMDME